MPSIEKELALLEPFLDLVNRIIIINKASYLFN